MKFKFTRKWGGGYLSNKKITPKKSLVIGITLGILVGGIGVAATTYFSASQVSFTPTNANWNVTNVEEAVDSLYSIASRPSSVAIKLGSGAKTYDVSSVYSDYANLTTANFIARTNFATSYNTFGYSVSFNSSANSATLSTAVITYDASTGSLTVGGNRIYQAFPNGINGNVAGYSAIADVWLIVP